MFSLSSIPKGTARLVLESRSRFSTASACKAAVGRNFCSGGSSKPTDSNNTTPASKTENTRRFRKPSVPFRDYDAVKRNAMGVVSREDIALDSFLSRHRPIFLMDLRGEQAKTGANVSPWFQSASGAELNPDMKYVPEDVVDRLRPFQQQMPLSEEAEMDDDPLLTSSLAQQLEKTLNFKIKGVEIMMPAGTSASLVLVKKGRVAKERDSVEKVFISTDENDSSRSDVEYSISPDSDSFLRPTMELTSVKRKRRIKMNRHKYKKRRKAQQAMRRKLKK